jgi:hypothetical protein
MKTLSIQEYVEYIMAKYQYDFKGTSKLVYILDDKYVLKVAITKLDNKQMLKEYLNYQIYKRMGIAHLVPKCYYIGTIDDTYEDYNWETKETVVENVKLYYVIQERVKNIGDNHSHRYSLAWEEEISKSHAYQISDDRCIFNFGTRERTSQIVMLDYTYFAHKMIEEHFKKHIVKKMNIYFYRIYNKEDK